MTERPSPEYPSADPTSGPGTPPLANRYGLIRPKQGRYVAGVCAAVGRATNTDPVLWRVLLAVLICFGGIGALAYLGLWLLTPEEGDTASPVEALLGRGHSSTSSVLAVVLAVGAAILLLLILPRPLYLVLLSGATVLVVLLLNNRGTAGQSAAPPGTPTPETPPEETPPTSTAGPSPAAAGDATPVTPATPAAATSRTTSTESIPDPLTTSPAQAEQPGPAAAASWGQAPPSGTGRPTDPPPTPVPPGPFSHSGAFAAARPLAPPEPFAPHGPFAGPRPMPPPARPPRPARERSALPALTFTAALLALGLVALLDLTGVASVPATGYVAAGLLIVGAGLLIGTWLGRARPLIAVGVLLALALPVVHTVTVWQPPDHPVGASVVWEPASLAEVDQRYELSFGEGVLDLREVDFTGGQTEIAVSLTGGEIRVQVPPDVPVTVNARVSAGNVRIFRQDIGGLNISRTISDPGAEGADPADGELVLNVHVRFGNIEVER